MKNKGLLGAILICVLILSACTANESGEDMLFDSIIEGIEISDLVAFKGSIYAGGMEGIYRIDPVEMKYEKVDMGGILFVKDLVVSGDILYAGHDGGITAYDGREYSTVMDGDDGGQDVRVNALFIDDESRLWAGTYSGAYLLEGGSWKNIDTEAGLMDDTVFLIMEDGLGGMIFGHYATANGGISYLNQGRWTYYNVDNGMVHNYVTSGMKESGNIYIGTGFYDKGGMNVFHTGPRGLELGDTIVKEWGEHGSKVRSLNIDGQIIWIGTEYNGLCIYEITGDRFTRLGSQNGLAGEEVKSILFQGDKVFLGMRNGVSVGNIGELYDYCGIINDGR